jgi:hypothetical protein
MNPHSYTCLVFDKSAKNICWSKDSLFYKCYWKNWVSTCRNLKLDPCLSPHTCISSKWIKDHNSRPETLKLLQERTGTTLEAISIDKDTVAQQLRERIDKWDYMKLRSFYTTQEMVSKLKRPPQNVRKFLPAIHQIRER